MEKGLIPDWAQLSVDLGYYDQAHFIKDFKAVLGRSPEEYIRTMGAGGASHHE
ncbi:AraC family transcriptional regulator [Paenibacillus sp. GYB004]|uniref:AraC family transcriptional regulator n=1 Tax=Paenibacillus sp. GYB004 TaxID=2994393 RepID=UPI002F96BDC0